MPSAAYSTVQVGGHRANSKRYEALVDAADEEAVDAYRWSMNSHGYAYRVVQVGGKQMVVLLHRFLLDLMPGDGVQVDHINGNRLDNRRANLRACTDAQNHQNRHDRPYRGTYWDAKARRWKAQAELAGKGYHLGYFDTQEEAAEASAAFRRANMPYSRDARDAAA